LKSKITPVSELRWPAPAKLNLFLHVTGRRPDGLHDIQTLYQLLSWGDEVSVDTTEDPEIERTGANYAVPEDQDLAVQAAKLLQSVTSGTRGAKLEVTKRIPMGAGLGGGSSDAATVLLVLNHLWKIGLGLEELAELGLQLGADVPLFIKGHSAMATGLGERLTPVEMGERHYLLILPDIHIPTREIFCDPGLTRNSAPISFEQAVAGHGKNDCEPVVLKRYPEISAIMRDFAEWGDPRMTGTGSGIFVPMVDEVSADSAARKIKCRYNVRAVRGVDRSPLHGMLELTDFYG
jgi:4-diphosphocytidyl-2-C-methyl-D-erythritol kinase